MLTKTIQLYGGPLDGQIVTHNSESVADGATMTFQCVVKDECLYAISRRFVVGQRKYRYVRDRGRFVFEKRLY